MVENIVVLTRQKLAMRAETPRLTCLLYHHNEVGEALGEDSLSFAQHAEGQAWGVKTGAFGELSGGYGRRRLFAVFAAICAVSFRVDGRRHRRVATSK